jgi:putative ABC transport system ATP-binding protein
MSTTATPTTNLAAQAVGATKLYGQGDTAVRALDNVDATFENGQFTAIMGPSGSGKSTLMHCLAGLDRLTSGTVQVGGVDLSTLSERKLTELRRNKIGFVFQSFNLVPTLTLGENIELPLRLGGADVDATWRTKVVDRLGLHDRLTHLPTELSGGQQQRAAVARSLVSKPSIIFADEPTGNLDSASSAEVLGFLRAAVDEFGQTIVMVTHEPDAAAYADRVLFLVDGRIVKELKDPTRDSVLDTLRDLTPTPDSLYSSTTDKA